MIAAAYADGRLDEWAIRTTIPQMYDVMVHIEPLGNIENGERCGRWPGEAD